MIVCQKLALLFSHDILHYKIVPTLNCILRHFLRNAVEMEAYETISVRYLGTDCAEEMVKIRT